MARLITSGGEIRDHPTSDIGSPDGWTAGAAATVTDTTDVRSGSASILCQGTATNSCFRAWSFTAPASGQSVFPRPYFWTDALPTATVKIGALVTVAAADLISVRLTPAGVFQLWNDAAGTQIGSDSALVVELGRKYRWQLRLKIAAGAADEAELLVKPDDYQADEESISGTGLTISDTHASRLYAGWVGAPGVTANMRLDDITVNDSTGTDHNTLPGEGRVVVLLPMLGLTVGSWTDCSGSANPQNGMNKQPPVGLADHTTAGHTGANAHQARVAVNTAQTMNLLTQTFAGAGVSMPVGYIPGTGAITGLASRIGSIAGNVRRASSFTLGAPGTFDTVSMWLAKSGSPTDDVIVEIQADSAGQPSGTPLATGTIAASTLGLSAAGFTIAFDQTLALAAGTYWIVARRSGATDSSNHAHWAKNGSTSTFAEFLPAVYDGTNWLQSGVNWSIADHGFQLTPLQGVYPPTYVTQVACHGQGATGVKAGTADAGVGGSSFVPQKAFNFADNVGVAGTYSSNWRWAIGTGVRPRMVFNTNPSILITKASGSGSNACLVCFGGILVEYASPPLGWARWQKTADSTFWWAKQASVDTTYETGTDGLTVKTVAAGDWAIYPDPQVAEGENFPTTLTSITDDTLKSGYTLA